MANLNIRRDARVIAGGDEVGRVTHVVVSPDTKEVTHLVVSRDGAEYEVPIAAVQSVDGDRVTLAGDGAAVGRRFERDRYHAIDEGEVRDETTRTAHRGGAPLQDADDDAVAVAGARRSETDVEARGDSDREGPARLQLREERLRVGTVREQAGEVELGKRVVERTETAEVPLREERVVIERRPVNERIEGEIADTDETVEIDVMRERAVAEKETVVTEEVGVRKDVTQRTERVQDTVRKEELVVEGEGDLVEGGRSATGQPERNRQ